MHKFGVVPTSESVSDFGGDRFGRYLGCRQKGKAPNFSQMQLHSSLFNLDLDAAYVAAISPMEMPNDNTGHGAIDATPAPPNSTDPQRMEAESKPRKGHSPRFWGIFVSLCILAFICALDAIIITTALPTITAHLGGAAEYVWIANSFVVANAVVQPLFGQLSDIFGRQNPLLVSTVFFILGSGIAGGATSPAMLIGGRTVQGVGAGGLYVILDIVCCDLVPLRERGKYVGLMNSWAALAAALGPVLGGALGQTDWRWIFYLNIPICGVALGGTLLFMRMKTGARSQHAATSKLRRIDYLGNLIFIPSIIAVLLGLIMGGIVHPWSSWQVILPIVLGGIGWIIFHVQQTFASYPSLPGRLFTNRTSAIGYILTFISSVLIQAISYFLPIYFQALKGTTVLESGIFYLPYAMGTLVSAVLGGVLLAKTGSYRGLHAVAFALSCIGLGLFTLLDSQTPKVAWVFYQLISSAGLGITVSTMLPAIMAALPESDVAAITAAYAFIKTFGYVWGVTMASIIFNAVVNAQAHLVSDSGLRDRIRDGGAYAFASEVHDIRDAGIYSSELWSEVEQVYTTALRTIWWVGLGISLVGLLAVGGERALELRGGLETEYGIDEGSEKKTSNGLDAGSSTPLKAEGTEATV